MCEGGEGGWAGGWWTRHKPHPQVEEKDCEARPPLSLLLRRQGDEIFSIFSALDAQQDRNPDDLE